MECAKLLLENLAWIFLSLKPQWKTLFRAGEKKSQKGEEWKISDKIPRRFWRSDETSVTEIRDMTHQLLKVEKNYKE